MRVAVQLRSGAKGVTDLNEPLIQGRRRVELTGPDGLPIGVEVLADPLTLTVIGYVE